MFIAEEILEFSISDFDFRIILKLRYGYIKISYIPMKYFQVSVLNIGHKICR